MGAKPSDPWTALDVAQTACAHLRLQNIVHWIKPIAIDRSSAGLASGLMRDLAVGHYKPINSDIDERYLAEAVERTKKMAGRRDAQQLPGCGALANAKGRPGRRPENRDVQLTRPPNEQVRLTAFAKATAVRRSFSGGGRQTLLLCGRRRRRP